jgi:hypothetical protein
VGLARHRRTGDAVRIRPSSPFSSKEHDNAKSEDEIGKNRSPALHSRGNGAGRRDEEEGQEAQKRDEVAKNKSRRRRGVERAQEPKVNVPLKCSLCESMIPGDDLQWARYLRQDLILHSSCKEKLVEAIQCWRSVTKENRG